MARYIDAEKLAEHKFPGATYDRYVSDGKWKSEEEIYAYKVGYNEAIANITQFAPTADVVEVVRCKDCIHRPKDTGGHDYGKDMEFPDDVCPCQVGDNWYSWMPKDYWFCADGERRTE